MEEVEHSRQSQPTTFKYPITSDGEKVCADLARACMHAMQLNI